jgi:hypothetical protein
MRGSSLVFGRRNRLAIIVFDRGTKPAFRPFAGAGIAVFLLSFIAVEVTMAIHAFRYVAPVAALISHSTAVPRRLAPVPAVMSKKRNVHEPSATEDHAAALAIHGRAGDRANSMPKGQPRLAADAIPPAN